MRTPEWIARCEPAREAELDIGVSVWDSYYVGPENGFTPEQWRELRTPLYRPQVTRRVIRRRVPSGGVLVSEVPWVSLATATSSELSELRRYFADVLRLMAEHGRQFRQSDPLFELQLGIFVAGDYAINWMWHWNWSGIRPVLDALASPVEDRRVVYDDVGQGWQVIVFATPTALFLRQSDFDTGEEERLITCQREPLLQQVTQLKATMPTLLGRLEAELGQPDLFGSSVAV